MTEPLAIGLLTRDGHLLDLSIERLLAGELEEAEVAEHLGGCPVCRERLERAAALRPPPLPAAFGAARAAASVGPRLVGGAAGTSRARPQHSWWTIASQASAAVAVAAVALLSLRGPTPEGGDPSWRARGGGLGMEVYLKDGTGVHRLSFGERVSPGDRVGFRVRPGAEGFLMIVGDDELHSPYPVWPASGRHAEPVGPAPRDLDAAIELDDTPGRERFVGIQCPAPFAFESARAALERGAFERPAELLPGCRSEVFVVSRSEGSP